MSISTMKEQVTRGVGGRTRARLLAIVGAVIAAAVVWAVGRWVFDVQLRAPEMGDPPVGYEIGLPFVVAVVAVASGAGWGLLVALERFTARARSVWTVAAVVVFALSLAAPWSGVGVDSGTRVVLTLMHVAVAAVLIPGLSRTSARFAKTPNR